MGWWCTGGGGVGGRGRRWAARGLSLANFTGSKH